MYGHVLYVQLVLLIRTCILCMYYSGLLTVVYCQTGFFLLHEQEICTYIHEHVCVCFSSMQSDSSTNMYTIQLSGILEKIGNISFQANSPPVIIPHEGEVVCATVKQDGSSDPGMAIIDLPRHTFREIVLPL